MVPSPMRMIFDEGFQIQTHDLNPRNIHQQDFSIHPTVIQSTSARFILENLPASPEWMLGQHGTRNCYFLHLKHDNCVMVSKVVDYIIKGEIEEGHFPRSLRVVGLSLFCLDLYMLVNFLSAKLLRLELIFPEESHFLEPVMGFHAMVDVGCLVPESMDRFPEGYSIKTSWTNGQYQKYNKLNYDQITSLLKLVKDEIISITIINKNSTFVVTSPLFPGTATPDEFPNLGCLLVSHFQAEATEYGRAVANRAPKLKKLALQGLVNMTTLTRLSDGSKLALLSCYHLVDDRDPDNLLNLGAFPKVIVYGGMTNPLSVLWATQQQVPVFLGNLRGDDSFPNATSASIHVQTRTDVARTLAQLTGLVVGSTDEIKNVEWRNHGIRPADMTSFENQFPSMQTFTATNRIGFLGSNLLAYLFEQVKEVLQLRCYYTTPDGSNHMTVIPLLTPQLLADQRQTDNFSRWVRNINHFKANIVDDDSHGLNQAALVGGGWNIIVNYPDMKRTKVTQWTRVPERNIVIYLIKYKVFERTDGGSLKLKTYTVLTGQVIPFFMKYWPTRETPFASPEFENENKALETVSIIGWPLNPTCVGLMLPREWRNNIKDFLLKGGHVKRNIVYTQANFFI